MPEDNEESIAKKIDSSNIQSETGSELEQETATNKKRGRGRPKKTDIQKNSPGGRKKVGRPKGDAAIINEYKARMLASPQSKAVLQTILDAANNPDHKHQAAAWKLVMDRILPVAAFEKDVVKGAGGGKIEINISGVPGVSIEGKPNDNALDADWTPVGETDA